MYLAQFITRNCRKYISGVREISDKDYYDKTLFIPLSEEVFKFLNEKLTLDTGKMSNYYVNEDFTGEINEVSKLLYDSDIQYKDDISYWIEHYTTMARELVFSRIKFLPIKLFEYISINNELISKGYFISEENKEEKYLEILNKESEEFIEKFIKYLEIMDKLSMEKEIIRKYDDLVENLQTANSKDEMEKLYIVFSAEYY